MRRWVDRMANDARRSGRGRRLHTIMRGDGRAVEHFVLGRCSQVEPK